MSAFYRLTIWMLAGLLIVGPLPVQAQGEQAGVLGTSEVKGLILRPDGSGAAAAEVHLVPLTGLGAHYRATTDSSGRFELEQLQHGYYNVGVVVDGRAYVGNRSLLLEPKKKLEAELQLGEFGPAEAEIGLSRDTAVPGTDRKADGVARLIEDFGPTGWDWFKTGRGVAVLLGGSTVLIGGLILLSSDEDGPMIIPSPSEP